MTGAVITDPNQQKQQLAALFGLPQPASPIGLAAGAQPPPVQAPPAGMRVLNNPAPAAQTTPALAAAHTGYSGAGDWTPPDPHAVSRALMFGGSSPSLPMQQPTAPAAPQFKPGYANEDEWLKSKQGQDAQQANPVYQVGNWKRNLGAGIAAALSEIGGSLNRHPGEGQAQMNQYLERQWQQDAANRARPGMLANAYRQAQGDIDRQNENVGRQYQSNLQGFQASMENYRNQVAQNARQDEILQQYTRELQSGQMDPGQAKQNAVRSAATMGIQLDPKTLDGMAATTKPLGPAGSVQMVNNEPAGLIDRTGKAWGLNDPNLPPDLRQLRDNAVSAHQASVQQTEDKENRQLQRQETMQDRLGARQMARQEAMFDHQDDRFQQQHNLPTVADRNRASLAGVADANLQQLEDITKRRPDLFGPAAGRYSDTKLMMGSNDPDLAALGSIAHNFAMANAGIHGSRSAQNVEATETELLNHFRNGPQGVQAAIAANRTNLHSIMQQVSSLNGTPQSPGAPTPQTHSVSIAAALKAQPGAKEADVRKWASDHGYQVTK